MRVWWCVAVCRDTSVFVWDCCRVFHFSAVHGFWFNLYIIWYSNCSCGVLERCRKGVVNRLFEMGRSAVPWRYVTVLIHDASQWCLDPDILLPRECFCFMFFIQWVMQQLEERLVLRRDDECEVDMSCFCRSNARRLWWLWQLFTAYVSFRSQTTNGTYHHLRKRGLNFSFVELYATNERCKSHVARESQWGLPFRATDMLWLSIKYR